jgi:hypothetical protein
MDGRRVGDWAWARALLHAKYLIIWCVSTVCVGFPFWRALVVLQMQRQQLLLMWTLRPTNTRGPLPSAIAAPRRVVAAHLRSRFGHLRMLSGSQAFPIGIYNSSTKYFLPPVKSS